MLFETAVTICIILNTAFLAVEHHGMSDELKHVLEIGNKVFTTFFTTEAALKLLALSKEYFDSGWNCFDLVIVVASLVDIFAENLNGISVLRGMRLVSENNKTIVSFILFPPFIQKNFKVLHPEKYEKPVMNNYILH